MRIIHKTISLEPYVSRLPGVAPALSGDVFVEFSGSSEERLGYGNYGMIPSDITIPDDVYSGETKITDFTDIYVNLRNDESDALFYSDYDYYYNLEDLGFKDSGETESFIKDRSIYINGEKRVVMSYQTIMRWYHDMKNYKAILDYSECKKFSSATEYYDVLIDTNVPYENVIYLPGGRQTYVDLDRTFESRGGWRFYNWVTKCIVPKFEIPDDYVDAWGTDHLYFPETIVWYGWMQEMSEKYAGVTDCRGTDRCCECSRFLELGGNEMMVAIGTWIEGARESIAQLNECANMEASVNIPIMLTRELDNMGEMVPMSEEFRSRVDYGVTIGDNYDIGTVVSYENDTYAIKGKNQGYRYDQDKRKYVFNESDWVDYTDKYVNENPEKFVPISSYTYSRDGKIVHNPTPEKMSELVNYTKSRFVLMGGKMYDVVNGYYVIYSGGDNYLINGKVFVVQFDKDSNPYVIVNRRKYTGFRFMDGYAFNFKGDNASTKDFSPMHGGEFVHYGNGVYMVEEGQVRIKESSDTYVTDVLEGYYIYDMYSTFYVKGDDVYSGYIFEPEEEDGDTYIQTFFTDYGGEIDNVTVEGDKLRIYYVYEEHEVKLITGYTSNKIENVRDEFRSTDELGNELPGYFKMVRVSGATEAYMQPYEGELLDLQYHIGNVTALEEDEDDGKITGNIIRDMLFYYVDYDGRMIDELQIRYTMDGTDGLTHVLDSGGTEIEDADTTSSIWAIQWLKDRLEEYSEGTDEYIDPDVVLCDMTYHVGARLEAVKEDIDLDDDANYEYYVGVENVTGGTDGYAELKNGVIHVKFRGATENIGIKVSSKKCLKENGNVYYKRFYVPMEDGEYTDYPGIVYKDTLTLTKDECFYNLNSNENYPLNYYAVEVNGYDPDKMNEIKLDMRTTHSYFETPVLIYQQSGDTVTTLQDYYEGNNGMSAFPMFRKEYYMGAASIENIDNDIYVDRGNSAAIDRHLKLGEVKTLTALASYSNGMFQIINDKG